MLHRIRLRQERLDNIIRPAEGDVIDDGQPLDSIIKTVENVKPEKFKQRGDLHTKFMRLHKQCHFWKRKFVSGVKQFIGDHVLHAQNCPD